MAQVLWWTQPLEFKKWIYFKNRFYSKWFVNVFNSPKIIIYLSKKITNYMDYYCTYFANIVQYSHCLICRGSLIVEVRLTFTDHYVRILMCSFFVGEAENNPSKVVFDSCPHGKSTSSTSASTPTKQSPFLRGHWPETVSHFIKAGHWTISLWSSASGTVKSQVLMKVPQWKFDCLILDLFTKRCTILLLELVVFNVKVFDLRN